VGTPHHSGPDCHTGNPQATATVEAKGVMKQLRWYEDTLRADDGELSTVYGTGTELATWPGKKNPFYYQGSYGTKTRLDEYGDVDTPGC